MADCERCGSEPGNPYTFLYGTSTTHQSGPNTYRTQFTLKGLHTMFLGVRCVGKRRTRTRIWFAVSLLIVLAAGLMFSLGFESFEQTTVFGVPVVVVGLVGIAALMSAIVAGFMMAVYRDPEKAGTAEAERLGQREMKRRGFNFTTSPENWAMVKAREPWGGNIPNRSAQRKEFHALREAYEARVTLLVERARQSGKADVEAFQNLGQ